MKHFKTVKKFGLGASLMGVAGAASADTATAITDAISTGSTNYGAVVAGVISVAALGFGLSLIVRSLSK
ncbi:hypothetical protein MACH09_41630 [Vibrio sp. MACH09]|uniref:hypothetical protein n=1 Tax=Vibrio sp. MACH09 TaxID=3025122 RepID=UPI002794A134|nr:hypothetical protein [Vibrio sp. MACH09]GLO63655.1 hypothetical protein MACH09_41630 [Vibrio sp. MACH09]